MIVTKCRVCNSVVDERISDGDKCPECGCFYHREIENVKTFIQKLPGSTSDPISFDPIGAEKQKKHEEIKRMAWEYAKERKLVDVRKNTDITCKNRFYAEYAFKFAEEFYNYAKEKENDNDE